MTEAVPGSAPGSVSGSTREVEARDAIRRLVRHVVTTRYEDLPGSAIEATKTFILDSLGVAFAGTLAPNVGETLRVLLSWGGSEESTVLAMGHRLPSWAAAMVNSFLMHNQEFDCVHDRAVVHPLTTVLPTALAVAEARGGVSGRDVLMAVALGADVAASLGVASRAPMRHFRPGTAGAFGAVAAAGKIMRFDEATLSDAMGIVYSQISGTLQPHHEGVAVNSMQTGFNARAAVTATALAREGVPGPRGVLEGPYGYLRLFEGAYDIEEAFAGLGTAWRVEEISHKPFPCGRLTHGVIEGALKLRSDHRIDSAQVKRCRAAVTPLAYRLVGKSPTPGAQLTPQFAKLSIPFVVATALCRGNVFVDDFQDERLSDAEVLSLAARIEVEEDPGSTDENAIGPAQLDVELHDGRMFRAFVGEALGAPANPLSRGDQLEKFRRCVLAGGGATIATNADRIIDMVSALDVLADIADLVALTVPRSLA